MPPHLLVGCKIWTERKPFNSSVMLVTSHGHTWLPQVASNYSTRHFNLKDDHLAHRCHLCAIVIYPRRHKALFKNFFYWGKNSYYKFHLKVNNSMAPRTCAIACNTYLYLQNSKGACTHQHSRPKMPVPSPGQWQQLHLCNVPALDTSEEGNPMIPAICPLHFT
jgi:hypothetical protein